MLTQIIPSFVILTAYLVMLIMAVIFIDDGKHLSMDSWQLH